MATGGAIAVLTTGEEPSGEGVPGGALRLALLRDRFGGSPLQRAPAVHRGSRSPKRRDRVGRRQKGL